MTESYLRQNVTSGSHLSRPSIWISDGDLERVTDRCVQAMHESNTGDPRVFRSGTGLVRLQSNDRNRLVVVPMTVDRMVNELAICIDWYRKVYGSQEPANPPRRAALSILASRSWPFPPLTGICRHPTFTKAGLIQRPGYDPKSKLVLDFGDAKFAGVAETPEEDELELAKETLLDHLFGDFTFANKPARANTLGATILPAVRHLIDGPTPLHAIDKTRSGTGGTLLATAIAFPTIGHAPSTITLPRSEDEQRRTLFAALSVFPEFLLLDNVENLRGSALAAALTSSEVHDRIVGSSESRSIPINCGWLCSGNNLMYSEELRRRAVSIRLDAGMEHPERRTEFRYPDLRAWMRGAQSLLCWSILTIVQAWWAKGRPLGRRRLGSYESYAAVVGGILEVAGISGFLEDQDARAGVEIADRSISHAFIDAWWQEFGNGQVKVKQILDLARSHLSLDAPSDAGLRVELGKRLAKQRDCRFGDYVLRNCASQRAGSNSWYLERIGSTKASVSAAESRESRDAAQRHRKSWQLPEREEQDVTERYDAVSFTQTRDGGREDGGVHRKRLGTSLQRSDRGT